LLGRARRRGAPLLPRLEAEPDDGYRRLLEDENPNGIPFRHALEFLHREQIRSPAQALSNKLLHLRQ